MIGLLPLVPLTLAVSLFPSRNAGEGAKAREAPFSSTFWRFAGRSGGPESRIDE